MAHEALKQRPLLAIYPLKLDTASRRDRGGRPGVRLLNDHPSAARQRRIRRCRWGRRATRVAF